MRASTPTHAAAAPSPERREILEILRYAAMAPSGHNAQPWLVRRIGADVLRLEADLRRRLPAVDPQDRELTLSLGAFLENLVTAAGALGVDVDCNTVVPRPRGGNDVGEGHAVAELRLRPGIPSGYPLERLSMRRTVRRGQSTRPIGTDDVAVLLRSVGEPALFYPRGSGIARYLDDGTVEANRVQAFRDAAQQELADWIRWSSGDAKRTCDGLTPKSLEIGGVTGLIARHFFSRSTVLTSRFREQTVRDAQHLVRGGGGWLAVWATDDSTSALIDTGRRLQRMLLLVRGRRIAVHPMSQMLEEVPFRTEIASRLQSDTPPQFVLRLGYVDRYPDPASLRRPVSAFTIESDHASAMGRKQNSR